MRARKRSALDAIHNLLYDAGYHAERIRVCAVSDAKRKKNPPLLQRFIVFDPRAGQICIGHNELLPAQRAQARRFHADMLDRTGMLARNDEVADLERPVKEYRKEAEYILKDHLRRKRNRQAAYAKAGQQSIYAHARILKE
ncbi:hypothetical protein SDC9_136017 [bioreactor metagenome]|uniref:Uncharacterized protein n=1 Tax=bioreactor metagenome TaxID=1076179 RepID=A0A645DJB4_9ZZZZ